MKPTVPLPPLVSLTLTRPLATIQSWRIGQVLRAIALTAATDGHARLRIGTQTVQAQTTTPVQAGQRLELQVIKLGPQPVLRLLTPHGSDPVTAAIRRVLPRQAPAGPLLANLAKLTLAERPPLPAEVLQSVQQLLANVPRARDTVTADQLRSAVRSSGLFLEARLARDPPKPGALAVDLKANLLRLMAVLRDWPGIRSRPQQSQSPLPPRAPVPPRTASPAEPPPPGRTAPPPAGGKATGAAAEPAPAATARPAATPTAPPPLRGVDPRPQPPAVATLAQLNDSGDPAATRSTLHRQVEGAVARLQLNQLASVSRSDAQAAEWLMELPMQGENGRFDVWSLRIRREDPDRQGRGSQQGAPKWSVTLAFDLPTLGPVQARVSVGGDTVSTVFWAERPSTHAVFERHLQDLRERLEHAGLAVDRVTCQQGLPASVRPAAGQRLLDESV